MAKKIIFKEDTSSHPIGWQEFYEMSDKKTKITFRKEGDLVKCFAKCGKKEVELWSFTGAAPEEGIMDWQEYKNRTNNM